MNVTDSIYNNNIDFGNNTRSRIFKIIIIVFAIVYIGRLAELQIIQGSSYMLESETQAIKQVIIEPFRGKVFDRKKELLVHNEPSFSIVLTPYSFKYTALPLLFSILPLDTFEVIQAYYYNFNEKEFSTKILPSICSVIKIDTTHLMKNLKKDNRYTRFSAIKIYKDANFEEVSLIEEYSDNLPGIEVSVESKRLYEFEGNMAHILGYTREITKDELKKFGYYRPGDNIGKKGLEKSYESQLRGQQGIKFIAVNSSGQMISKFNEGRSDKVALNGFDLNLGIDKKLQELAEKLLEGKRGSIVALDPRNGEVIILAAKPDYDPRVFTGKISKEFYNNLINDKEKPMFNRALQSLYSPGSTWKMLMALAALQEGVITEKTTFNCAGGYSYGGRFFKCHGAHGTLSVVRAIQVSCNSFFYQLGLKLGMERFEKYGKMFGFGELTYIDLQDEAKGIMPTMEWLNSRPERRFTKGKLLNYGIGQGEISVTPIQMAIYCSAIASKGMIFQPHVVREIYNNITNRTEPIAYGSRILNIDKKYFDLVQEGMYHAVNTPGGTALSARIPGIDVCGKTGTAQNPHGRDHAWFICFAPKNNPEIAMCVMVENSGFGGAVAAPIAREILFSYFYPDSLRKPVMPFPGKEIPPEFQEVDTLVH